MAGEHLKERALAHAALQDIIAKGSSIQAATIRKASPETLAAMRQETHDILDAYLDHMTAAAVHVRQILEP